MEPDAVQQGILRPTTTGGVPEKGSGIIEEVRSLWQELRGLTQDRFHLAALETQRAGESLVAMIIAAVMFAVLLSGAWLGLMAVAVLVLIENGVAATTAILQAVVLNVLIALILYGVMRRKSRYLRFPATLRSLQPLPQRRPDAGKT